MSYWYCIHSKNSLLEIHMKKILFFQYNMSLEELNCIHPRTYFQSLSIWCASLPHSSQLSSMMTCICFLKSTFFQINICSSFQKNLKMATPHKQAFPVKLITSIFWPQIFFHFLCSTLYNLHVHVCFHLVACQAFSFSPINSLVNLPPS